MDKKALENLCSSFLRVYYSTRDADRSKVQRFYDADRSIFTFKNKTVAGGAAIANLWKEEIKVTTMKHVVKSCDSHVLGDSVLLLVCGDLFIDGNTVPVKFAETFVLVKAPSGNYMIQTQIFALNDG